MVCLPIHCLFSKYEKILLTIYVQINTSSLLGVAGVVRSIFKIKKEAGDYYNFGSVVHFGNDRKMKYIYIYQFTREGEVVPTT